MGIELRLECISQNEVVIRFRLSITNHEPDRIYMPYPGLGGLRFTDAAGAVAAWRHRPPSLGRPFAVPAIVLEPEDSTSATFTALPSWIERYPDDYALGSYCSVVDITTGQYDVQYSMVVDAGRLDEYSHGSLHLIERQARERCARAWTGEAESNVVRIEYAEPEDDCACRIARLQYEPGLQFEPPLRNGVQLWQI